MSNIKKIILAILIAVVMFIGYRIFVYTQEVKIYTGSGMTQEEAMIEILANNYRKSTQIASEFMTLEAQ